MFLENTVATQVRMMSQPIPTPRLGRVCIKV